MPSQIRLSKLDDNLVQFPVLLGDMSFLLRTFVLRNNGLEVQSFIFSLDQPLSSHLHPITSLRRFKENYSLVSTRDKDLQPFKDKKGWGAIC